MSTSDSSSSPFEPSDRLVKNLRVVRFKAKKPEIDGDNDGFVDDGKPTQRPAPPRALVETAERIGKVDALWKKNYDEEYSAFSSLAAEVDDRLSPADINQWLDGQRARVDRFRAESDDHWKAGRVAESAQARARADAIEKVLIPKLEEQLATASQRRRRSRNPAVDLRQHDSYEPRYARIEDQFADAVDSEIDLNSWTQTELQSRIEQRSAIIADEKKRRDAALKDNDESTAAESQAFIDYSEREMVAPLQRRLEELQRLGIEDPAEAKPKRKPAANAKSSDLLDDPDAERRLSDAQVSIAQRVRAALTKRRDRVGKYMEERYGTKTPWRLREDGGTNLSRDDIGQLVSMIRDSDLETEAGMQRSRDARKKLTEWARSVFEHQEIRGENGKTYRILLDEEAGVSSFSSTEFKVMLNVYEVLPDGRTKEVSHVTSDDGGGIVRTIRFDNGVAYHDLFYIPEEGHKRNGLSTIVNNHALTWLKSSGFDQVRLGAAWDGKYVWGRVGFEPVPRQRTASLSLVAQRMHVEKLLTDHPEVWNSNNPTKALMEIVRSSGDSFFEGGDLNDPERELERAVRHAIELWDNRGGSFLQTDGQRAAVDYMLDRTRKWIDSGAAPDDPDRPTHMDWILGVDDGTDNTKHLFVAVRPDRAGANLVTAPWGIDEATMSLDDISVDPVSDMRRRIRKGKSAWDDAVKTFDHPRLLALARKERR